MNAWEVPPMSSLCSSCYVSTFLSVMCTNSSLKRQFKERIFYLVVLHLHVCACTHMRVHTPTLSQGQGFLPFSPQTPKVIDLEPHL